MRIVLVTLASLVAAAGANAQVSVAVDGNLRHQTIEGFGATTLSLAFADVDNVPSSLRARGIEACYGEVGITMGNLEVEPSESSSSNVFAPQNDDSDPQNINPAGFNWAQSDNMMDKIVTPASAYGVDDFHLGPLVGTGFALAFALDFQSSDHQRYLDEIAEHVVAVAEHWRDAYAITPRFIQPFNEPTSGNGELVGGSTQEIVEIVKRIGARLDAAGLGSIKLVVPAQETEQKSLDDATAILNDVDAAPYVGAIAFHPYPYGSTYASVPNILATSGSGAPDAAKIGVRAALRDLGAAHGVPVWMVEVSHSELAFDDFSGVRGRAIHIHDELVYADVAAFFGMNAMWDTVTHAQHFAGREDSGFFNETDTIVLLDVENDQVFISPMGRAIGHYARFLTRGAVRVDATSSDPLVLVTSFVVPSTGAFVSVLINTASAARDIALSVANVDIICDVTGEQSTAANALWQPIAAFPSSAASITTTLPALSVTTLSVGIAGGPVLDAGVVVDGGVGADGGSAGEGEGAGSPGEGDRVGPPAACGCAGSAGAAPLAGLLMALSVRRRRRGRARGARS